MYDQLAVLKDLTIRLEQADIAYMLSGSMAMNYYAQPRMTRDIDVVMELQATDIPRLAARLGEDYYFDADAAQAAIVHESLFNVLHHASLVKIDCIVRKQHPYRREEFSRRRRMTVGDFELWIVSAEDLLLSKLDWLKDSRSDWPYLRHWARELGILPLLEEVQA